MSKLKLRFGWVSDEDAQINIDNGVFAIPPHKLFFAYFKA
jgi:hypothetical protein